MSQQEQPESVQQEQTDIMKQNRLDAIQQGAENMRQLNLMSDTFVSVALEDIPACQHVVRTILGRNDIEIIQCKGTVSAFESYGEGFDFGCFCRGQHRPKN